MHRVAERAASPLSTANLLRSLSLATFTLISAWGGAALAVPPVSPPVANTAVVTAYIKAIRDNDLEAYEKLFAPDATIESDWPKATNRAEWLKAMTVEFAPNRTSRFPAVYERFNGADNDILLVEETRACAPLMECFSWFRTETLTIRSGLIIGLKRSGYSLRLANDGVWTTGEQRGDP